MMTFYTMDYNAEHEKEGLIKMCIKSRNQMFRFSKYNKKLEIE